MKNFSNTYIFLYASGLVIVVAMLLSFASIQLKPLQKANLENRQMQDILASINVESDATTAGELFKKYIKKAILVDYKGNILEEVEASESTPLATSSAFTTDLRAQLKPNVEDANKKLPLFVGEGPDGQTACIVPIVGYGLGGPIWGYISFGADYNSVVGITFDHVAETPGLGAKITEGWFKDRFKAKKIFDGSGKFMSIRVLKGGIAKGEHEIDAVSGGTITSNGVDAMLKACLVYYEPYFKNQGN